MHSWRMPSVILSAPLFSRMQPPPTPPRPNMLTGPFTWPLCLLMLEIVTVGATVALPISRKRKFGVPTTVLRWMERVAPFAVMMRSSRMTGNPFRPLLAADSTTSEVTTMRSRPAAPAAQPPTAVLVLAASMACTSEQVVPVEMVAAFAGTMAVVDRRDADSTLSEIDDIFMVQPLTMSPQSPAMTDRRRSKLKRDYSCY